jgi:hypothetical protein
MVGGLRISRSYFNLSPGAVCVYDPDKATHTSRAWWRRTCGDDDRHQRRAEKVQAFHPVHGNAERTARASYSGPTALAELGRSNLLLLQWDESNLAVPLN